MTECDRPEFDKALATMAVAMRENITEDVLDIYFSALRDLEIKTVANAIISLSKTAKFFPKVGEIRELAAQVIPPYRQKFLDGEPVKQISDDSQKPSLKNGAIPTANFKAIVEG